MWNDKRIGFRLYGVAENFTENPVSNERNGQSFGSSWGERNCYSSVGHRLGNVKRR